MAEVSHHGAKVVDQLCVGNSAVIVTGSYNIGQSRLCKVKVEAYIYDTATPANSDFGEFIIFFRRFTNGAAIVRSVSLVPFTLPGTLAGSAVSSALINGAAGTGNTIVTRFTNPSTGNRSIRVISDFQLITIQD